MATRTGELLPLLILRVPPPLFRFALECAATAGANLAKDVRSYRGRQVLGERTHVRREIENAYGVAPSPGEFGLPRAIDSRSFELSSETNLRALKSGCSPGSTLA
jgi:hypothetical protein